MRHACWLVCCGVLLGACGSESDDSVPDPPIEDEDPDPVEEPDLTGAMFRPDHIIEVEIDMLTADWDTVRQQTRNVDMLFGDDCLDEPFGSPFTYQPATVTIDGETVANVGVRKKGLLGSLDTVKPSLKIKFSEYEPGQRFSGLKRMTLNNNKQDAAYIRQCIGYQIFADAGIPAPRCSFAHVTVNGVDLGLYSHIESVKKRFLSRHYDSNDGRLYEGTLSDFRDGWMATFEPKTDKENPDRSDIEALKAALEVSDDLLLETLEPLIDVDQFLTFWAAEVLVAHQDGYNSNTNNFFSYTNPTTGKIEFMPWGIDSILYEPNPQQTQPAFLTSILANRLYSLPATRDRYRVRMRELLDTVWDEDALNAEIDRMQTLLAPIVASDPFLRDRDFATEVATVSDFVSGRRASLLDALAQPPATDIPLRESFCFAEIGDFATTFSTVFGPESSGFPGTGDATLTGTLDGAPIEHIDIGSSAGVNSDDPSLAEVAVILQQTETGYLALVIKVRKADFVPGVAAELDFLSSFLVDFDTAANEFTIVGVASGSLELEQAGTTDGDAVVGSFSGIVYNVPF